jgi:hypothetical protein
MKVNIHTTDAIRSALERRILHGLSCEWEAALWGLPEKYRDAMRKPLFNLRGMKRRLGQWDPEIREIGLSREFVFNHPWQAVRDVLHHEMAHQLAHEVLGGQDETAHGKTFHEACRLLRIVPDATGTYDRLAEDSPEEPDRILLKIRKLFALAESPNPHEAEAAMLKAHELIARYNVDLMVMEQRRKFVSRLVGAPALRHTRDRYALAALIQDFYFVQGVWVPVYVMKKGKMGRVLELSGTVENVETASYIFDYIDHYIDGQWRMFRGGNGNGRGRKVDFALGVLDGFRQKLQPSEEGGAVAERALVAREDPQLAGYLKYRYPYLRSFRRQGSEPDPETRQAGFAAGESLVIAKGIRGQGKSGRLLTGGQGE